MPHVIGSSSTQRKRITRGLVHYIQTWAEINQDLSSLRFVRYRTVLAYRIHGELSMADMHDAYELV